MVRSNRQATVGQFAEKFNAGSNKMVSEHTVHRSLLRMGPTSQDAHADSCPQTKAPTMGMWASKLNHGAMEEGGLV